MKKISLFVIALFYLGNSFAQNEVAILSPSVLDIQAFENFDNQPIQNTADGDGRAIRSINEINDEERTDSYPWISADGLKLYFTKSTLESGHDLLYMVSRETATANFGTPELLNVNSYFEDRDVFSAWLTNSELDVYFIVRGSNDSYNTALSLYHSERTTTDIDFSEPELVILNGEISGFISAPSLTQDQSQLYLYNDDSGEKQILVFEQNGENNYDFVDVITAKDDFKVGSGQLSKDGLSYTLSLKNEEEVQLYAFTRTTLSDDFVYYEKLESGINDENLRNLHPSFSANNEIVALVRSDANDWSRNELYIGYAPTKHKKSDINISKSAISLYPNPTSSLLTISNEESSFDKIQVFTVDGKLVLEEFLSPDTQIADIDVSYLNKGIYICTLTNGEKWTESLKFVVQ